MARDDRMAKRREMFIADIDVSTMICTDARAEDAVAELPRS